MDMMTHCDDGGVGSDQHLAAEYDHDCNNLRQNMIMIDQQMDGWEGNCSDELYFHPTDSMDIAGDGTYDTEQLL